MQDDILVVGGGFAGLAAGVELARAGRRVRLLERNPHLGGRARSFREATTGSLVDNGQHILMGAYQETIRFLETIGTLDRIRFQPSLEVHFIERGRGVTRLRCPSLAAPWHLLAGVVRSDSFTWREKLEIARLGRALKPGVAARDGTEGLTVEDWLARLGQSESLRRNFWDLFSIAAMNEDPRRASAALFRRVLELALFNSPEFSRIGVPRAGLSECYTAAAAAYIEQRGGGVERGRAVSSLALSDGVCRGVTFADGETLEADSVISAVPWFDFVRLLPEDLLNSEAFFSNIRKLRPAPIISINLWLDRSITDLEFVGLRGTTVQWLFNRARVWEGGENLISLVLSGAHEHIEKSKEELVAIALADLRGLFPAAREAVVRHSQVIKERFATFSPAPDTKRLRPPTQTSVRGLYLAGDWTATGLPATIEGAVKSGRAAAEAVLRLN
jgi:zeta-carotene desaturase